MIAAQAFGQYVVIRALLIHQTILMWPTAPRHNTYVCCVLWYWMPCDISDEPTQCGAAIGNITSTGATIIHEVEMHCGTSSSPVSNDMRVGVGVLWTAMGSATAFEREAASLVLGSGITRIFLSFFFLFSSFFFLLSSFVSCRVVSCRPVPCRCVLFLCFFCCLCRCVLSQFFFFLVLE